MFHLTCVLKRDNSMADDTPSAAHAFRTIFLFQGFPPMQTKRFAGLVAVLTGLAVALAPMTADANDAYFILRRTTGLVKIGASPKPKSKTQPGLTGLTPKSVRGGRGRSVQHQL